MEAKGATYYNSIIVPSVQEMAKGKMIKKVPQRYVRSGLDKAEITDECGPRTKIPIIDLNRLCSSTYTASEIDKLDLACKEWGFFQLVNHGIDPNFLDKLKSEIQDFFNLPMEEKKKLWQQPCDMEGFGQAHVVSEEQKLDWGDMFYLLMQPARLRKPHLFPKLPLPFRDTLETYSTKVKTIAQTLLVNMEKALKIEPKEIEELFGDDLGLTILLQVNEVEGLQIKRDGKWVTVKPLPNAFIVNIGDMLEVSHLNSAISNNF
ncbi:hypothetical protein F2Q70_00033041 [Brassica cretica]|uniref:Fe2OG dioxygenase domain-containing protein n=1 Tax=Brassica cretica TaxID=69181 RepID=A0A8S9FVG8_BRACR|nr:hypothetical protein F2Q70_00033041 [Brassica cretica]